MFVDSRSALHALERIKAQLSGNDKLKDSEINQTITDLNSINEYIQRSKRLDNSYRGLQTQKHLQKVEKEQLEEDRKNLQIYQESLKSSFKDHEKYLKSVQLGGYAAFFGLWAMVRESVTSSEVSASVLLMLASITIFVGWEAYKALTLSLSMMKSSNITPKEKPDDETIIKFARSRNTFIFKTNPPEIHFSRIRLWITAPSVLFSIASISIFAFSLAKTLWESLCL